MKHIFFFILVLCTLNVRSQPSSRDTLLLRVTEMIRSDQVIDINKLDSIHQHRIINYLYTYDSDSLLYRNIENLFRFISDGFFSSRYTKIRQDAANLMLDIYRISIESDLGYWHKKAKQIDFNLSARKKIMSILNAVPFTDKEKELLYKNELKLQQNSFSGDTLRIRAYRKKSQKTIRELQDSLAISVAIDNINNRRPEQYVLPGIILLAAWLDMKEAIPIIEKQLAEENYESIRNIYKLALARLGNTKYEEEILNRSNVAYDLEIIGFLATKNSIDKVIKELKTDESNYKIEMSAGNPVITIPYVCEFLIFQDDVNFIMNFPFNYDNLTLDCGIGKEERGKIIKWLEQNRESIVLNRDYH